MKPKGLVAAASITSQTSIFMRSHINSEFVYQTDVDHAEGILQQLDHLGYARGTHRHNSL